MKNTNKTGKKNKAHKTSIVFDATSRKDFLTGFRKRKNERRKKAKEQLETEYKEEVRKAKQKAREDVMNAKATGASHQIVPEIADLIREDCVDKSTTEDYGTHTVSVTHLNAFGRSNKIEEITNDDIENTENEKIDSSNLNNNSSRLLGKNDLKDVNKLAAKNLSKSKAFAQVKAQSKKGNANTAGGKKATQNKKFSKKCTVSKREKHYNPRNKSHKKNKDK